MCVFHLPTQTRVSEVHFRTQSLGATLEFYVNVLGFQVIDRTQSGASLSANGQNPALIRFTLDSKSAVRRPEENGLSHIGIRVPSRADLARVVRNLVRHHQPFDGGTYQNSSESIYVNDPDGNKLEFYHGLPEKAWGGRESWDANPLLGLNILLASIKNEPEQARISPMTEIGHIHFNAANLEYARRFFNDFLGLDANTANDGSLSFSADGVHPQIEVEPHRNAVRHAHNSVGLISYKLSVPCGEVLYALNQRAPIFGYESALSAAASNVLQIRDPIGFLLEVDATEAEERTSPNHSVASSSVQGVQRSTVELRNEFSLSTKVSWKTLFSFFA